MSLASTFRTKVFMAFRSCLLVLILLLYVSILNAQSEQYNTGWELYIDNDAFALLNTDQDYTGGLAVSLLGRRAVEYPVSLDAMRDRIDKWLGHKKLYQFPDTIEQHSIEIGLESFTPKDTISSSPIFDDRPYASLLFLSNSYKATFPEKKISFHSSFTIGFLGLRVADEMQKILHGMLGQSGAGGWGNQISDGGELTAQYSFSRQKTRAHKHIAHGLSYEVNTMFGGSVGYITDVGVGLFGRAGRIYSPWWSFNPHHHGSIHIGAPIISANKEQDSTERYFWSGINLKYRVYNALLQGQFRESTVTFTRDELNSWIVESWLGYTRSIGKRYRINFTIRASTPELKIGEKRSPVWGSFTISKSI